MSTIAITSRQCRACVSVLLLLCTLLISCSSEPGDKLPSSNDLEGTITVSGAFALYPLMVRWGEEFHELHPNVTFDISAGGAGKGMADTLSGAVDIGMVSRAVFEEEIEKGAFWVAVAKDAVVGTVNAQNPVLETLLTQGITRATCENIWITQEVTTWGQAINAESGDEIHIFETVSYLRDLSYGDLGAVSPGNHSYIFIVRSVVATAFGPEQNLSAGSLDVSRRQVQAPPSYGQGHLA